MTDTREGPERVTLARMVGDWWRTAETGVEYVRSDILAAAEAERDGLRAQTQPTHAERMASIEELARGHGREGVMERQWRLLAQDSVRDHSQTEAERDGLRGEEGGFMRLVADGIAEAGRAIRKFPQPNYVISKVAEEAGEVVKAAIHCAERRETPESVLGEMRQLIAMLYRLYTEGDQVHGLPALRPAAEEGRAEPRDGHHQEADRG